MFRLPRLCPFFILLERRISRHYGYHKKKQEVAVRLVKFYRYIFNAEVVNLIDEKEWQNFLTDCKVYKDKVDNLMITTKEQEKRITQLEMNNTKTDLQYEQIMKTLNKLVEQTIPQLSKEIQEIKEKPVKRWETVVVGIIGAIAGGVGTAIVNLILNK